MSRLHGNPIPDGGCLGEARRALADGAPAMREWSGCMAAEGHDYPDVWAAGNDIRWGSQEPTTEEIATATADVTCKHRTNVAGIFLAVESAYQKDTITRRAEEFDGTRTRISMMVANAERVAGID